MKAIRCKVFTGSTNSLSNHLLEDYINDWLAGNKGVTIIHVAQSGTGVPDEAACTVFYECDCPTGNPKDDL